MVLDTAVGFCGGEAGKGGEKFRFAMCLNGFLRLAWHWIVAGVNAAKSTSDLTRPFKRAISSISISRLFTTKTSPHNLAAKASSGEIFIEIKGALHKIT